MNSLLTRKSVFSSIILVFLYAIGIIGILTSKSKAFIYLTPIHLIITTLILLNNNRERKHTTSYSSQCFYVFMSAFLIGVFASNTSLIYGKITYGDILGPLLFKTPITIGILWLGLVVATSATLYPLPLNKHLKIILGALLITSLDFLIELTTIKIRIWSLENGPFSFHNSLGWFFTSLLLLYLFQSKNIRFKNKVGSVYIVLLFIFFFIIKYFYLDY